MLPNLLRVTDETLIVETAVWHIPFLINVFTALKGSVLIFISQSYPSFASSCRQIARTFGVEFELYKRVTLQQLFFLNQRKRQNGRRNSLILNHIFTKECSIKT